MVDCASRIVAKEGPLAFYKGTATPLLGAGLCVSIQFGVVEHLKRRFAEANARAGRGLKAGGSEAGTSASLTSSQLYASGVLAGIANAFVAGVSHSICAGFTCNFEF